MAKRKRQKKGPSVDLDKPVTLSSVDVSLIGTDEDCFGKMHEPTDNECRMCGDASLCLIMQGQLNRNKRLAIEEKSEFRDIKPKKKLVKSKTSKK
mgnify:CR=1 FL=1